MNKKALVFAVAAACLTSGAAFAQSYGYQNDSNSNVRSERHERSERDDRRYGGSDHRRDDRYRNRDFGDYRADYRQDRGDYRHERNDYRRERGDYRHSYYEQPRYQHYRGGYVQQEYRDQRYVVNDWRGSRLYQPQRGYHWVQAGNDYLLVAIATGLIAQVILNH